MPFNRPNLIGRQALQAGKVVHVLRLTHRDEVEAPITDWLREAYELPERLKASAHKGPKKRTPRTVTAKGTAKTKGVRKPAHR